MPSDLQRLHTDFFADGPQIQPFDHFDRPQVEEPESELFTQKAHQESIEESSTLVMPSSHKEEKKAQAKSIATKNVCFNICQKTVKVIQKQTYGKKVTELCDYFGANEQDFIDHIIVQKKFFTGPKALGMYVDSGSVFA